jgi:hypothetical protein
MQPPFRSSSSTCASTFFGHDPFAMRVKEGKAEGRADGRKKALKEERKEGGNE